MVTRSEAYDLYKSEHLYVDGTETVTVRRDGGTSDADVTARRSPLADLASTFDPIDLQERDQGWIIYADTISFTPIKGDTIVDGDGVLYQIRSFIRFRWDTQYHCVCSRIPTGAS